MKIDRHSLVSNDYAGERLRKESEQKKPQNQGQDQLELHHDKSIKSITYSKPEPLSPEQRQELVQRLRHEADVSFQELRNLVTKTLKEQGVTFEEALRQEKSFEINEETRQQAEQAISEDGPFGVKKTTERIMQFAKALAGDDQTKITELREAVKQGFKEVNHYLNRDLPQLSKDTYSAIMKEFDLWEGIEPQEHQFDSDLPKKEDVKPTNAAVTLLKQIEENQTKVLEEQLKKEQTQPLSSLITKPLSHPSSLYSHLNIKG